jgi:hypothetical protein
MPIAWITEYGSLGIDGRGVPVPIPAEPAIRTQVLHFGRSTACEPFAPGTCLVRIVCSADLHMAFGRDPVAHEESEFLPARCEAFRLVKVGQRVALYDGVTHGDDAR